MSEPTVVDHRNSGKEIVDLLKRGGVNLKTLNKGKKKLSDLLKEIRERDIVLILDEEAHRVTRFALSVKLLVITRSPTGCLREVRREYENTGEVVYTDEPFSMSETQQRGEDALSAVKRGMHQEYDIDLDVDELLPVGLLEELKFPEPRKSRVYREIYSSVIVSRFIWITDMIFDQKLEPIKDHGVHVYVEWFPGFPRAVQEWLGSPELSQQLVAMLGIR